MRVKMGELEFTKCKFSSLDGKTVVTYKTDDDKVQSRADSLGVSFTLNMSATNHEGVAAIVHTFGKLLDATYQEHVMLKPKFSQTVSGH